MQSGFGRTGKLFAIEHYGVEPDIMTHGQGHRRRLPAVAPSSPAAEIADAFQLGDHLSTFGGNPVSCAAALANIDFLMRRAPVDQAARKGAALHGAPEELKKTQPLIGEVRGQGLMIGVELVADRADQGLRHRRPPASCASTASSTACSSASAATSATCCASSRRWSSTTPQLDSVFATVADGMEAFAGQ